MKKVLIISVLGLVLVGCESYYTKDTTGIVQEARKIRKTSLVGKVPTTTYSCEYMIVVDGREFVARRSGYCRHKVGEEVEVYKYYREEDNRFVKYGLK